MQSRIRTKSRKQQTRDSRTQRKEKFDHLPERVKSARKTPYSAQSESRNRQ
ncbi:MAG: hypothetical protein KBD53_10210 [Candidatus Omnitrophica bacterium]|nr:hypothetical protein [Candidatus Omnitrophota bacterium]